MALSTQQRDVVVVQETRLGSNGPGPLPDGLSDGRACYPVTYARLREVERILETHYAIQARFNEGPAGAGPGDSRLVMSGFWGRLRLTGASWGTDSAAEDA